MIKTLILILVGLVIVVGGWWYWQSNDASEMNEATATNSTSATSTASDSNQYIAYSDSAIAQTEGTKVLFFHAPWCPQCRQLESSIQAGTIPEGVTIIKVDYDTNQALRQQYGVTIQTTLVRVDDQGNLVKKYVAYDEPTLENLIENVL